MFRFWPIALIAGIFPFGGYEDPVSFPVEARGDIKFHLDGCRFRSGEQVESALYLSIPQVGLAESPDSSGFVRLSLSVEFEDVKGDEILSAREVVWIPLRTELVGEESFQPRHLLTLRPKVPFGTIGMRVRIEDSSGKKRGVLDRIRGKKPYGEARARFDAEPFACGFSDLAFAWDIDLSAANAGLSPRRKIQPNPLRYFGLFNTTVLAYVEVYGPPGPLAYEVLRLPGREVVAEGADSTGNRGGEVHSWLLSQDVSALPSGSYRLEVWRTGRDSCRVGGDFQVLWESASWTRDQEALLEEAYVLLGPSEYEQMQEMSPGEAEAYLTDLWRRHDPDPSTGRNELRQEFASRVAHANTFYGTSFRKGMLTDRGRVYIRYGQPDEIEKVLNPQDRDLLANVLPGQVATDRVDIIRKPLPRNSFDNRAYEIWFYQVRGEPLFPEQMTPVQRTGLKFIFVDELGYGDMRMIYTNIAGAF